MTILAKTTIKMVPAIDKNIPPMWAKSCLMFILLYFSRQVRRLNILYFSKKMTKNSGAADGACDDKFGLKYRITFHIYAPL
jgi:hypothetical protein